MFTYRNFLASGTFSLSDLELSELVAHLSFGKLYVLRMISKSVDYYFFKEFIKSQADKVGKISTDEDEKISKVSLLLDSLKVPIVKMQAQVGRLRLRRTQVETDQYSEENELESFSSETG